MKKEELISIIIPVYKVEECLDRCVRSIVAQTYNKLEIILVDDGSPDRCPQICDEWAKVDERIKVIHKENGGLSDARNAGLDIMKGQYVVFVDSDDYIHPQFVELMYYVAQKYNVSLVDCRYARATLSEEIRKTETFDMDQVIAKKIVDFSPYVIEIQAWGKIYKREIFDHIRYPKGRIHEDAWIWWKIMYQARKVAVISEQLYYYTVNPTGIVHTNKTMKKMDLFDGLYDQYLYFRERSEEKIANKIMRYMLNVFPGVYMDIGQSKFFDKKQFFSYYKKMVKIAKQEKCISANETRKHTLYCNVPQIIELGNKIGQKLKRSRNSK